MEQPSPVARPASGPILLTKMEELHTDMQALIRALTRVERKLDRLMTPQQQQQPIPGMAGAGEREHTV